MEIRPAVPGDLDGLAEIDATIEAADYFHVEHAGDGLADGAMAWRIEARPLRERAVTPCPPGDDLTFAFKSVAGGIEDGLALFAEHDDRPAAALLARPSPEFATLDLIDVRVDYDFRREGIATAMLFQLVTDARRREARAVRAETLSNNLPAGRLMEKLGFEVAGVDTRRRTNHDLVKEQATLIWYLPLD